MHTGKNNDKEIDFVIQRDKKKAYIQVAWSVIDEQTREREMSAFHGIKDAYPRYLISMDDFDFSEQGIKHIRIFDFLTDKTKELE